MAEISRKIYTRRGDGGQTKLLSGETVQKDDLRVSTYGALDELQSALGMARALIREELLRAVLHDVQKDLFVAGSELASAPGRVSQPLNRLTMQDVARLETWIDSMTEQYGTSGGFIIPGASLDSAAIHLARSVCRRVERLIVSLNRAAGEHQVLIVYFNRLSDLLFVLAWSATVMAAIGDVLDGLMPASTGSPGKWKKNL